MDIYFPKRDQMSEIFYKRNLSSQSTRIDNGVLSQSKNVIDPKHFYNLVGRTNPPQPFKFKNCNFRYQTIS